jgi:hypothetical protein
MRKKALSPASRRAFAQAAVADGLCVNAGRKVQRATLTSQPADMEAGDTAGLETGATFPGEGQL